MADLTLPAAEQDGQEAPASSRLRSKGARATLNDVALIAGVSKGTVSRVLSGNAGAIRISAKTEEQVRKVAASLDYQPNAAARALGRRRTETVAFVIPSAGPEHHYRRFSNLKISELLSGIDEATAARGYNVILQVTAGNPFADPRHQRVWKSRAVDGLIWLAQPLYPELGELPFPVVAINAGETADGRIGTVNTDEYGGSVLALSHLAALGHRRIAHIAGPQDSWSGRERLRAYRDFVDRHSGLALIESGDGFEQSGEAAIGRLLAGGEPPTALFVGSDRMAIGVLTELRSRRINVPRGVAVIGADGMDLVNYSVPRLTTVAARMASAAQLAVEMLLEMIEHPDAEQERVVAGTELVILESCGYRGRHSASTGEIVIRRPSELDHLHSGLPHSLHAQDVASSGGDERDA